MAADDYLHFEKQANGIATLVLNRPELRNAFDDALLGYLAEKLHEINRDDQIRVVILKANGKSFCAGADINWMQRMINYSYKENIDDARKLTEMFTSLKQLSKPTIAMVHGDVFGGGNGLVACCDIAISSRTAQFCFSEVKLGLIPAVISPFVVEKIGQSFASRYFLTAEIFSAETAKQIGLVHEIVEEQDLHAKAMSFAEILLKNSPNALTETKILLRTISQKHISNEVLNFTAQKMAELRASDEGQAGLKAFLNKEKAPWVK